MSDPLTAQAKISSTERAMSIAEGSDHLDIEEARLPYVYQRTLGSGGCSIVDEVKDRNTGRSFARKVFMPRRRDKMRMKEMFHNELRIIRSLEHHHHMIRVFASYTVKDTGTMALLLSPVANGGDLDKYLGMLSTYKRNPSSHTARIKEMTGVLRTAFGCLAAGLAFIHSNRVRHKDIKAQNILVHDKRVLYTDFSLSFDSSMCDNSTTEGPTSMTRRYAAPEVLAGAPRNSSSDIYSLGCVFIEMLAALTDTVHYDDAVKFTDSMKAVHDQLNSVQTSSRSHIPSVVTLWMTLRDPKGRWTAETVWSTFSAHPQFRCDQCGCFVTKDIPENTSSKPNGSMGRGKGKSAVSIGLEALTKTSGLSQPSAITEHARAATSEYYTPWKWSKLYNQYYCYLLDVDGTTRVKTIWSGVPNNAENVSISEDEGYYVLDGNLTR